MPLVTWRPNRRISLHFVIAKAGDPVRGGLSIDCQRFWNTGSPGHPDRAGDRRPAMTVVREAMIPHPLAKSHTSFTFSAMISAAVSVASTVSQRGATNGPILARLAVNITSGTTANGNCRLSTT
jgi:hypothetical protein